MRMFFAILGALLGVTLLPLPALAGGPECEDKEDPRCAGPDTDPAPSGKEVVSRAPWAVDIKPSAPTWCGKELPERDAPMVRYGGRVVFLELAESIDRSWTYDPTRLAASSCFAPNKPSRQAWVATALQQIANFEGLSKPDLEAMLKLSLMSDDEREADEQKACERWSAAKRASLDERVLRASMLTALKCSLEDNEQLVVQLDLSMAGRRPEISSEIEKGFFLQRCLNTDPSTEDDKTTAWLKRPDQMGSFMSCGADTRSLDRTKLDKEIAKLKLGPSERIAVGRAYGWAIKIGHRMNEGYKAFAAKDPDYKAVLFEAPEAGFKQWTKAYESHKAAMDEAFDLEQKYADSFVRKSQLKAAFGKCAAPLRKSFVGYVKSAKPKSTAELIKAATDEVGYPILSALVACEYGSGNYAIGSALRSLILLSSPGVSNPRDAAFLKASYAMAEIRADRKNFGSDPYRPARVPLSWVDKLLEDLAPSDSKLTYGDGTWMSVDATVDRENSLDGEVASVKKGKQQTLVTFKKQTWKEQVYNCKSTGRVDRIDFSVSPAQVRYQQNCKPAGSEKRSSQLDPMLVPNEYLGGIKPGVRLRIFLSRVIPANEPAAMGLGLEGFADDARKKLVHILGIAL
jgi:hypothetical protein